MYEAITMWEKERATCPTVNPGHGICPEVSLTIRVTKNDPPSCTKEVAKFASRARTLLRSEELFSSGRLSKGQIGQVIEGRQTFRLVE
jgi:hypothetical protein